MNQLIKVNQDGEKQTVSARNLWEFLGRPYEKFTKWFNQYKTYGFTENEDYRALCIKFHTAQGNEVEAHDFEITIDMGKELSMLQKSEKGKIARRYFIDLEKAWNSPDQVMARALQIASRQIDTYKAQLTLVEKKIEQDKPKVIFADAVSVSKTSILVGELAKLLRQNGIDTGQNRFFEWLRNNEYLIKRKGTDYNMPTQRAMDMQLFEIKETTINHSDGHVSISKTPKVTGKGQIYFINKFKTQENKEWA